MNADPLPPIVTGRLDRVYLSRDLRALVVRRGPSWAVHYPGAQLLEPLTFLMRDVRTDDGLRADVSAYWDGALITRTSTSLSLTARGQLARRVAETLAYRGIATPDRAMLDDAVERACLGVLEREDDGEAGIDLRTAELPAPGYSVAVDPLVGLGSTLLNAPGETGKSTIARAVGVSVVTENQIIPGFVPRVSGPVLFVIGEDAVVASHAASIDAICRGAGIDRLTLPHPLTLIATRGRPLHRLARTVAERARDVALVIIDSYQSVQSTGAEAGIRERESAVWSAVDEIERPTLIVAHPNRADARGWDKADGRVSGAEVSRDRARLAWRLLYRDVTTASGARREYTVACTKANDYARPMPVGFTAWWSPGSLTFTASEPFTSSPIARPLTATQTETLAAYWDGATVPVALAAALGITRDAAKQRLGGLRTAGLIPKASDDE